MWTRRFGSGCSWATQSTLVTGASGGGLIGSVAVEGMESAAAPAGAFRIRLPARDAVTLRYDGEHDSHTSHTARAGARWTPPDEGGNPAGSSGVF